MLGVALFFENPVVHAVRLPTIVLHASSPETSEEVVIGSLFEIQILAVVQVLVEFLGGTSAKLLDSGLNFLLFDLVILVVFVLSGKSLPGELPLQEVKQDVTDGLHIVAAGLLNANMGVDTRVTGSSSQALVVPVRNMLSSLGILVPLRQSEVDHVAGRALRVISHQEVIRLHVPMQEVVCVHVLQSRNHLLRQHAYRLQSQAAPAILEQIL